MFLSSFSLSILLYFIKAYDEFRYKATFVNKDLHNLTSLKKGVHLAYNWVNYGIVGNV